MLSIVKMKLDGYDGRERVVDVRGERRIEDNNKVIILLFEIKN